MARKENQIRHEKLTDFLSQFKQYNTPEGKPRLRKIKEERDSTKFKEINVEEINNAVVVFTDVLNISSGSAGDVNLYELLQAYIKMPECRGKINAIVKESLYPNYKKEYTSNAL